MLLHVLSTIIEVPWLYVQVSVSKTVEHQVDSEIPSINVLDIAESGQGSNPGVDAIFGSLPFPERFLSGYSGFPLS